MIIMDVFDFRRWGSIIPQMNIRQMTYQTVTISVAGTTTNYATVGLYQYTYNNVVYSTTRLPQIPTSPTTFVGYVASSQPNTTALLLIECISDTTSQRYLTISNTYQCIGTKTNMQEPWDIYTTPPDSDKVLVYLCGDPTTNLSQTLCSTNQNAVGHIFILSLSLSICI